MSEEFMTKQGTGKIGSYKDLIVWQKSMALAKGVYALTQGFPSEEKFGLTSQMRRASVSVPSNIAEGQARRGAKEFIHFISQAEGSLAELDTQLLLAIELGYAEPMAATPLTSLIEEVRRMLNALRRKLESKQA